MTSRRSGAVLKRINTTETLQDLVDQIIEAEWPIVVDGQGQGSSSRRGKETAKMSQA